MKVSVVIIAYNEEKYIGHCLESIKNQVEAPDEVIVVDNNSKDNTVKIAEQYGVRIVHEKQQGMTPARNAGFNAATGEIIARCDSDTVVPKDWIKKIKAYYNQKAFDALTGPTYLYDTTFPKSTFFTNIYILVMKLRLKGNDVLIGPNMILTKKAWETVKDEVCMNDKVVHEDIDLTIHLLHHGLRVVSKRDLVVGMSGRRIVRNPASFFIEYLVRNFTTFKQHS
ncbi:MAG: glycosyltransferase family 2 protein [Patescibacteria group bacterium]